MSRATTVGMMLGLLACAGEDNGAISGGGDGSDCGAINVTRRCSCGSLNGSQSCGDDGWNECTCVDPKNGGVVKGDEQEPQQGSGTPAGNLRSDIKFKWEETEPVEGSCEPGYYEGDFMGLYASGLTFVNAPIPVFALGQPGRPGLSFTLTKTGNGETLEIKDGKMDGVADGAFPFIGTLTGTLDCTTLKFEAILDGYYSLGAQGVGMFQFKGPLIADYDKVSREVINATWNVTEYNPPPVLPGAGGTGTWHAHWVPPP